jgi:hypothetical protein
VDRAVPAPVTPPFYICQLIYIRQLTDVSRCKLQQYLSRK